MNHQLEQSSFTSDRPIPISPFVESQSIETVALDPKSFDLLPLGATTFFENITLVGGKQIVRKRTIEIVETIHGRAITASSYGRGNNREYELAPSADRLMEDLGYLVTDSEIAAVPSPQSVKKAAGRHGVELAFFKQYAEIPGRMYLKTFANRKFPVSLSSEYEHDIGDDHLSAMVMGGLPLQDALADIGERFHDADEDEMKLATAMVDDLTAMLRTEVADYPFLESTFVSKPYDFYGIMGHFGIGGALTAEIIDHTRESANSYGLVVR